MPGTDIEFEDITQGPQGQSSDAISLFGGRDPFAPPPQKRRIEASLPARPGSSSAPKVIVEQTIAGYNADSVITVEGHPVDDKEYDALVAIITKAF